MVKFNSVFIFKYNIRFYDASQHFQNDIGINQPMWIQFPGYTYMINIPCKF